MSSLWIEKSSRRRLAVASFTRFILAAVTMNVFVPAQRMNLSHKADGIAAKRGFSPHSLGERKPVGAVATLVRDVVG
jgi:hypothetical protein